MFYIGEFSQMAKTTVKTLRYYDDIGLLKPAGIDKFTGYRIYTTKQLLRIHAIQSLRQLGLSIDDIKDALDGSPDKAILYRRRQEILETISLAQAQLSSLDFILQEKGDASFMSYQAVIKELPSCIVYAKRFTVANFAVLNEVLPALGRQIGEKYPTLKCAVPEYCFVTYLDGEYRERDIQVEYCEAVTKLMPDFDGIHFKELPAVKAVSVMHKGSYNQLPQAYAYIFQWLEENGYQALERPRESYIDGVWNQAQEDDWLTELQVPIVPRGDK